MPAVAAKVDKVVSSDVNNNQTNAPAAGQNMKKNSADQTNQTSNAPLDSLKIANQIIEKKIRNLEKRKARLLELKAEEDKGKQITEEQKIAVKKLDNVVELIDTVKEIGKNVSDSLNEYNKQLKKQQKKEQQDRSAERAKEDQERLKLWIQSQFVLARLSIAKPDLLIATDAKLKLDEKQIDGLEKLAEICTNLGDSTLSDKSLEKITLLLDGSKKEFVAGLSYLDLKVTLQRLIESKYFDSISLTPAAPIGVIEPVEVIEVEETKVTEAVVVAAIPSEQPVQVSQPQPISFLNGLETELHKDPAVVAVASSAGSFIAPNGSQVTFASPHFAYQVPVSMGSIPSQTFTNQNYQMVAGAHGGYAVMPVTGTQVPNVAAERPPKRSTPTKKDDAPNQTTAKPSSEQSTTSQPSETKVGANVNGGFKRGGPRGPYRGRGGRGGGHFRNQNAMADMGGGAPRENAPREHRPQRENRPPQHQNRNPNVKFNNQHQPQPTQAATK